MSPVERRQLQGTENLVVAARPRQELGHPHRKPGVGSVPGCALDPRLLGMSSWLQKACCTSGPRVQAFRSKKKIKIKIKKMCVWKE